ACTSASLEPSHVLMAMGVPVEMAHGSIRFTFGWDNTDEDVDYVLSAMPDVVERLRAMSPLAAQAREEGAKHV
ncbi:MAG: cysteine desulfurase NifS, partial [Chloroflexi bacterium]|nr:cysteine desulfurase NifS [Chloroflexota bacterium]